MPYGLNQVFPPAGEPVALADLKTYLRVDSDDTTQDGQIADLLADARKYCETATDRQLVSAGWFYSLDRFPRYSSSAVWQYNSDAIWQQRLPVTQLSGQWYPDRSAIRLPRAPLQFLQAIAYSDGLGVLQSLVNTIAAGVPAPGSQAVTPASMLGISVGLQLIVDVGPAQETVTITAVTATTFTATFAGTHPANVPLYATPGITGSGNPLLGGALVNIDTNTEPGRIAPGYGQIWPIVRQQLACVQVYFVAGFGPVTTIAASIAAGPQTVTPATMFGIYPGVSLRIDTGTPAETVGVSAVTATTFTAQFAQAHTGPVAVYPGLPREVLRSIRLLVAHWYEHREAAGPGRLDCIPIGVEELLGAAWTGEYH